MFIFKMGFFQTIYSWVCFWSALTIWLLIDVFKPLMFVWVHSCCYSKAPQNWVACKQQKCMCHSSGGLKFEIRVPVWLSKPSCSRSQTCQLSLHVGRSKNLCETPFIRSLIPSMKPPPSWTPNLPPNIIFGG